MGRVYKETFTKPLPPEAEIFIRKGRRFAKWADAKRKTRTAPLTAAGNRIIVEAGTYTAKYTDGEGIVRKVTTGCRDEQAARAILAGLERRAVRVKSGILTGAEDSVIDWQAIPLTDHFRDYKSYLEARGVSPVRIRNMTAQFNRVAADCGFRRLGDLNGQQLTKWLNQRRAEGMSAATRNGYREACIMFANWCAAGASPRLLANPFAEVPKADAKADPRRKRRAMGEAELIKLLDVARRRPLHDAKLVRRGKRQGEAVAKIRPEVAARLELVGRERALIYKTLVLTGLRKGELASLTVGQLHLDGPHPFAELAAADEKNRQGSSIPLRADLADDLRAWLAERATALQQAAGDAPTVPFKSQAEKPSARDSGAIAGRLCQSLTTVPQLPADAPLFTVPAGLVRILDRDLKFAGIAKRDERGRTLDVHALRHSFGTLLSKGGVAPRTAQSAMRHSTIDLTMNVYTDPKLLDIHGALDALPALPLDGGNTELQEAAALATGTDDLPACSLVPPLVPTLVQTSTSMANAVKMAVEQTERSGTGGDDTSCAAVKENNPLTIAVSELPKVGATRFELATSTSRTYELSVLSVIGKEVTATPSAACTAACTGGPENANGTGQQAGEGEGIGAASADRLAELAVTLAKLSAADRARLLALLDGANG